MQKINLIPIPITREAFAPFGDLIETSGAASYPINEGTTTRFHNLAAVDVNEEGGNPLISIFRGEPRSFPFEIKMMESHPIASQAFYPLSHQPYLVVVAKPSNAPTADDLKAFTVQPDQGVNYHRGVWHHPLLSLNTISEFLIIDRGGPGENLDEYYFDNSVVEIRLQLSD